MKLLMPPLGDDADGGFLRWQVKPGDEVRKGQTLAEVETDQAVCEIPAPFDGWVDHLLVNEGDFVSPGAIIMEYDDDIPDVDFLVFSDMYAKMKEAGQLERARRFMERYKDRVKREPKVPRTRFEREDPI